MFLFASLTQVKYFTFSCLTNMGPGLHGYIIKSLLAGLRKRDVDLSNTD